MDALRRLHADRRERPDHRHLHLSPGHVIPTRIAGGDWPVTSPTPAR